jgi:dTDP-4-dehydrorhamnose 3,5-epimerase
VSNGLQEARARVDMNRFSFRDLALPGVRLIERQRLGDSRGFLARLFCAEELVNAGWSKPIAQITYTYTAKCGTVRGMHFQHPPHAEMKLVTCIRGEIWDVAVDIRAGSPTFLQWHAELLVGEKNHALLIPEGLAHGFQALSDNVEIIYFHSAAYEARAEAGFQPTDPRLAIGWPLTITELSARDAGHPLINKDFTGVMV